MTVDRAALREALRAAYPWLDAETIGPRAVDAGECDRCGQRPRLLPTCGPAAWPALCADCAAEVGPDGWCQGHADEGAAARSWAAALPPEWPDVVRLWWVATGEVRLDVLVRPPRADRLPPPVHALLDRAGTPPPRRTS